MAIIEGWKGSVYVGGTKYAELNHWRANPSGGITEKTSFGDEARTRTYTIKDIDGDISGNFDQTDTSQVALIEMFVDGGTMADVFLYLYTSGVYGLYGNALVTPSVDADAVGLDTFNCGFVGDDVWYSTIANIP